MHPNLPARLALLLCLLPLLATASASGDPPEAGGSTCKMSLAQGFLEVRRAQYETALELFREAIYGGGDCLVEAHLGLATAYNSMNDHKRALQATDTALLYAEDEEILAEIHFQIGLAYDHRRPRMDKKKAQAVEAFERTLELAGGEHPGAIRSLLRIYKEVKDTERVAEFEARYPGLQVATRAEQRRAVRPKPGERRANARPDDPAAHFEKTGEGPYFDCATRLELEPGEEPQILTELKEHALPFGGDIKRPEKVHAAQPHYTEEARKDRVQGVVIVQSLIDTEGEIPFVKVLEGLPQGLNRAAINAICGWRFRPATLNGEPVAVYFNLTVNFRLQ